jgi:hypothetical protein
MSYSGGRGEIGLRLLRYQYQCRRVDVCLQHFFSDSDIIAPQDAKRAPASGAGCSSEASLRPLLDGQLYACALPPALLRVAVNFILPPSTLKGT